MLDIWREQWVLNFLSSKPLEISKNTNITNKTSSKVIMILRIWRAWLKNWACHALLNFKGAWQAHFLSHALHILKIIITFEDVLLVQLVLFHISHGLEDRKIGTHCPLHLLSTSLERPTEHAKKQTNTKRLKQTDRQYINTVRPSDTQILGQNRSV